MPIAVSGYKYISGSGGHGVCGRRISCSGQGLLCSDGL